jgi:hypothetical protein
LPALGSNFPVSIDTLGSELMYLQLSASVLDLTGDLVNRELLIEP